MKEEQLKQLAEQLTQAEETKKELSKGFYLKNAEALRKVHQTVLDLQRKIAKLRNEEYCEALPFGVVWDSGAPCPHILQNEHKTFLLFYLKEEQSALSRLSVTRVDLEKTELQIAVVHFKFLQASKIGSPNDEVLHRHPLFGKGLDYYRPFLVKNSSWIAEQENINKVHFGYKPTSWEKYNHYLFTFHDSTFECIAQDFEIVEIINGTMKNAVQKYTEELY